MALKSPGEMPMLRVQSKRLREDPVIRDTFVTEREQLLWTISWMLSGLAGVMGGMQFWISWTVGWFAGFLVLAILMKNKEYTEDLSSRVARLEQRVSA